MLARRARELTIVATSLAVLAACGESTSGSGGDTGTIHGVIEMTGGPSGALPVSVAGTVVVRAAGLEVRHQVVHEGQEFEFELPAGKYELSVSGVSGACLDAGVTVRKDTDQAVSLICQRK